MKNEFILFSKQQKAVSGTANVLVDSLAPFNGVVENFITDGIRVQVNASQQFDTKRSGKLQFSCDANIRNGVHEYNKDSGLSIMYLLIESSGGWTKIRVYSGVYGSGAVEVAFDKDKGTLAVGFNLEFSNSPSLKAIGAFRDVSGLEHVENEKSLFV
jgi:hypothetical protein